MNKTGRTEHALGLLLCKSRCVCDRAPRIEGSGLLFFMFISVRPGSSDRGRPADVTPPEVDLGPWGRAKPLSPKWPKMRA